MNFMFCYSLGSILDKYAPYKKLQQNSTAMKLVKSTLLAFAVLVWAVSCSKKDKDSLSVKNVPGSYTITELELYNPDTVIAIPSKNGSNGKIDVTKINDSTVKVHFQFFNAAGDLAAEATYDNARLTKDPDGDIAMTVSGGLLGYVYEGYEMDLFIEDNSGEMRVGAKKK
jgi:hypothetical protein